MSSSDNSIVDGSDVCFGPITKREVALQLDFHNLYNDEHKEKLKDYEDTDELSPSLVTYYRDLIARYSANEEGSFVVTSLDEQLAEYEKAFLVMKEQLMDTEDESGEENTSTSAFIKASLADELAEYEKSYAILKENLKNRTEESSEGTISTSPLDEKFIVSSLASIKAEESNQKNASTEPIGGGSAISSPALIDGGFVASSPECTDENTSPKHAPSSPLDESLIASSIPYNDEESSGESPSSSPTAKHNKSFDDTLEEIEMFMMYGQGYKKKMTKSSVKTPRSERKLPLSELNTTAKKSSKGKRSSAGGTPNVEKKSNSLENRSPVTERGASSSETKIKPVKRKFTRAEYNELREKRLETKNQFAKGDTPFSEHNVMKPQFKAPAKKPFVAHSPKYNNVFSPVGMYINDSPKVPLVKSKSYRPYAHLPIFPPTCPPKLPKPLISSKALVVPVPDKKLELLSTVETTTNFSLGFESNGTPDAPKQEYTMSIPKDAARPRKKCLQDFLPADSPKMLKDNLPERAFKPPFSNVGEVASTSAPREKPVNYQPIGSPKAPTFVLPKREYRPAQHKLLISKENEIPLPDSIRKLIKGPVRPEVVKHMGRIRADTGGEPDSLASVDLPTTHSSTTSAGNTSTDPSGDISLLVSKNAARSNALQHLNP